MTTVYIYLCSCLLSLYDVGIERTTVQVFVGIASFEWTFRRSERIDDLGHVLSLVLGYRESLVVGLICDRYRQGFQHPEEQMWCLQDIKCGASEPEHTQL